MLDALARRHPEATFLHHALAAPVATALPGLPCTLLIRGGTVVDCVEGSPADANDTARRLHVALLGAAMRARLQHADCAARA